MKWKPEDWTRLGARIRQSREDRGLSRKKLSERSGLSEKSIQLTEEGRVPTRWPKSLHTLEDALGWAPGSVMDVLDGREPAFAVSTSGTLTRTGPLGEPPRTGDFGRARHDQAEAEDAGGRRAQTETGGPAAAAGQLRPLYGAMTAREIELAQAGHLAQDVFMRQAKRHRQLRGLSIEQLAKKLAGKEPILEEDDIRRLEDGTRLLRKAEADAIAAALETTVDFLLGSSFSNDAPEEMRRPPDDKELEAEANAVMRRIADVGAQLNAAHQQAQAAAQREQAARAEAAMAQAMVQSVRAQQAEMEKHYQYLLGRIDSIRAARGEETAIQIVPVYGEGGE